MAKKDNPTGIAVINFRDFVVFITPAGNHNSFLGV